jgi:DNA invertase Pin-like site-specific DNA recombinase
MKTFAYIHISSNDQNVTRKIEEMKAEGIHERNIFIDMESGKEYDRPNFQLLKQIIRKGDTVVFDSITHMGLNMNETMSEYEWFVQHGIQLRFIKEPMINTNNKMDDILKQTIQKIILTLLSAFAEKERKEIKIRHTEGIAVAKKRGVYGRPPIALPKDWGEYYKRWRAREITAVEFMNAMGMKKTTFYRKVKEYEASK